MLSLLTPLILLLLPPLTNAATLNVAVDVADNITMKEFDHRRTPSCCWLPGCWVVDIIGTDCPFRCDRYIDFLDPTPSSDRSTFTYDTPDRCLQECYCGAQFDEANSFVLMDYSPAGAEFPYFGYFQLDTSGSSTSTTIHCVPDTTAQSVTCEKAVMQWNSNSNCDTATVTINLGDSIAS